MANADLKLFKTAVENEALAVLTMGQGMNRRQLMVQLQQAKGRDSSTDFAAKVVDNDQRLVEQFLAATHPVSLWFQHGSSLLTFEITRLTRKKSALRGLQLLMRWPQHISILEERNHPRYWVPADFALAGRVEVLSPKREVVSRTAVRFWDIGVEGASVICPAQQQQIKIATDDWVNLNLRPSSGESFTLPAVCRHVSAISGGGLRLGVQFMPSGDPAAAAAHAALSKLLTHLGEVCNGVVHVSGPGGTLRAA